MPGAAPIAAAAPIPAAAPRQGVPRPAVEPVASPPRPVASLPSDARSVGDDEPAPQPRYGAAETRPSADDAVTCPQCGHSNSTAFKFCASCGFNLAKLAGGSKPSLPALGRPGDTSPRWKLVVLKADGTDAGTYEVPGNAAVVGRETGGIFGNDLYLSPQHASLSVRNGKLTVQDNKSLNGTYIKLRREEPELLADGQLFRIGQEIIRFERLHAEPPVGGVEKMGSPSAGFVGRIVLITGRDVDGSAFPVPQLGLHIGRERGHVMFPEDGYVSGYHCSLTVKDGAVLLTDHGSSNGTFVRLTGSREVVDGDILLMGQQLFRACL